uniref:Proline dehydrogenase n=1 Tax=Timema poppense TaxID=170557 RepID=A0A7R9H5R2_TIMPO|nr:unnamed protein product [Timema poppensis]
MFDLEFQCCHVLHKYREDSQLEDLSLSVATCCISIAKIPRLKFYHHHYKNKPLNFTDHRSAFQHKDNWELFRALLVLRACGSNYLVDNSLKLGQRFLGERVLGWVLRPTLYKQFVAGTAIEDLAATTISLHAVGLRLMVAPTLEEDVDETCCSQTKYENNLKELLRLADMAHTCGGEKPCLQVKMTALLAAKTLEKLSKLKPSSEKLCTNLVENMAAVLAGCSTEKLLDFGLNLQDCDNICLALQRLSHLGKVAVSKDVHLLVDAEYSYVNSGCSIITLAMMAHFNQHSPLVANTFQCYFKDTWKNLNDEINISQQLGACFAAKIVRGAYLEKERCISPENVCTSHACTGENYNKTLEVGLHHAVTAGSKRTLIIIATHNENSVISALQSLQDMGISRRDGHVVFAQIYGMGEQISMPLAHAGYIVYKSVPMGPLNQVLPYLARRVAENRSVLRGARKERELLQQELKHRVLEKLHVVNIK